MAQPNPNFVSGSAENTHDPGQNRRYELLEVAVCNHGNETPEDAQPLSSFIATCMGSEV